MPLASRIFTNLTAVIPGVSGTSRVGDITSYSGGNGNIMMDGISTMDTGNNATLISVNTESIEEIKILAYRLPGRVWPLQRRADQRGHQERHRTVSWHGFFDYAPVGVERIVARPTY